MNLSERLTKVAEENGDERRTEIDAEGDLLFDVPVQITVEAGSPDNAADVAQRILNAIEEEFPTVSLNIDDQAEIKEV